MPQNIALDYRIVAMNWALVSPHLILLFTAMRMTEAMPKKLGRLGGSVVEHLLLAQVVIPGSWNRVQHQGPRRELASPSSYVYASLVCLS